MKSEQLVSVLVLAAAVVSACSTPGVAPAEHRQTLSASRAKMYQAISDLATDSVAVAVVRATASKHIETVAGIPFTVTTVSVVELLAGDGIGSTLSLRQLGTADVRPEDWVEPVQSNADYVVFLQHFSFGPGHPTEQFVVTGDPAGLFRLEAGRVTRLDAESAALPASVSLADLRAQLKK